LQVNTIEIYEEDELETKGLDKSYGDINNPKDPMLNGDYGFPYESNG